MAQRYKTLELNDYCHIAYKRNPMGKIKAIIGYGRYAGKYFDIKEQHEDKRLLVTRLK